MKLEGIISIAGKPGLYKVIAQLKNSVVVEEIITGKKVPAYATDRISALDDISIYTYEEDIPLGEVYEKLYDKTEGKEAISHKASGKEMKAYMSELLPEYDEDRVYNSDLKKLFQWFNLLQTSGLIKDFYDVAQKAKKPAKKKTAAKAKKEETSKEA